MIDTKALREMMDRSRMSYGFVVGSIPLRELCNAYDTLYAKESPHGPAVVRVRIAVAVTKAGHWVVRGSNWHRGDEALDDLDGALTGKTTCRYWIEAELPLPTETTVAGIVTPAENV